MDKEDYKQLIIDALYKKGVINRDIYERCSKPHIQELPYDLRTSDSAKLNQRKDEVESKINDDGKNLDSLTKKIESENKIMESSKENIEKSVGDVNTNLEDIYDSIILNNGKRETMMKWDSEGYINEYKMIEDLLYSLNWNMGELYESLPEFYNSNKNLNKMTKDIVKNMNDLQKQLSPIYNNASKLVYKKDLDNIKKAKSNMNIIKQHMKDYNSSKDNHDKYVVEYDNIISKLSDYNDDLEKIDAKLSGD